jgi:adenylate kinase
MEVIYLTGAPATGKSTLLSALEASMQPMLTFSYSKVLADYVGKRHAAELSQDEIRTQSGQVVTPADVDAVDRLLLESVTRRRNDTHIVIDSHAVTKEKYGFRVTPFKIEQLIALRPTLLFCLYADPEVIRARIAAHPAGRPQVTPFEAETHNTLQANVALIYGIHLGIPVYFLDSAQATSALVNEIRRRAA